MDKQLFITPSKIQQYTQGRWINSNEQLRFDSIGISGYPSVNKASSELFFPD